MSRGSCGMMSLVEPSRTLAIAALVGIGVIAAFVATSSQATDEIDEIATDGSQQAAVAETTETTVTSETLPVLRAAPDLVNLDGWLQSDIEALDELEGKVVVLQFWTFACRNCKATIPNLQEIYATFGRDQVEIVGVHAPEFSFEADEANIVESLRDLGVGWPIALDADKKNFHSWQEGRTGYWPRTYVIDQQGQIRFDHIGEGKYQELQDTVAALVAGT